MSKIIYKFMDDALMRLMFSEVTDLTYVYDTSGNILFVNKIFEKFTGQRPEEFYGKPFTPLFDGENLERANVVYKKTLQGESSQCELYFKTTGVVCEYKNFPLRDEKGAIIGVMGIARDITVRKQVEEGLVELNRSLEKRVIDHSAKLREMNEELMEEVNNRKRLEREYKRSVIKLQKSLRGVMQVAALTIESKDSYSVGHQRRVSQLARNIAEEMGLSKDRIEGTSIAAALHDIGKVSIPTEVLYKSGQLTEHELCLVKNHSRVGYDLLKEVGFPFPVAHVVFQHHERIDGSGYPLGLSGNDILLESKILGVADVVDAMSFSRPYRAEYSLKGALEEISQKRGILYDFNVVHACLMVFGEKGFKFEEGSHSNLRLFEDVLLRV